jgi:hypothetical protein
MENSQFVKVLSEHGFLVIYSHIKMGQDFLLMEVPECNYFISNLPYSQKGKVLERLCLSPRVNYIGMERKANERVPFQSGYICSGICSKQLEFDYMEIHKKGEGANG